MDIYVGNLSFDVAESDVSDAFSAYGNVESVKIVNDRETGRPRGFGFVTMSDSGEANNAIENLNGFELLGRAMKVNESRPREEGSRRSGGGGNSRY